MLRRVWTVVLLVLSMALCGCQPLVSSSDELLDIYATFYPIYALTDSVTMGVPETSLHCLIQPQDGCLRSYQLSDWDSYLLHQADLVIAGGHGLESFEQLLFHESDRGPAISGVLYDLELYNGNGKGEREESHLVGPNPHLYMSIDGARQMIQVISATMSALDPGNATIYENNEESALAALDKTRTEARATVGKRAGLPVAIMNEALIYVARDYELEPAVWIERESGEALYGDALEACLTQLRESNVRVVLIEQQAPASLISALKTSGFSVAKIDVLSTHREGEGFDAYIQAQISNAQAIQNAFQEIEG